MYEQIFGNEFKWFERTSILSLNTLMDDYVVPFQRTIPQKFQMETMKALISLREMKLISAEDEYNYLSSDLYKLISELEVSYNSGAFVLLVYCINDFLSLQLDRTKIRKLLEWINDPDMIPSVADVPISVLFNEYILKYGITSEDLIRYIIYIENFRKSYPIS